MPLKNCQLDGRPGFKWGKRGKCYTYDPTNRNEMRAAKQKAIKQGKAMQVSRNYK